MAAPDTISGLSLWFKADAITGLADGAGVSSWADSLGLSTASQATAAKQPTYRAGVLNGLPVIRFAGAQRMTLSGAALTFSNNIAGASVFVVASSTSTAAAVGQIILLSTGASTSLSRIYAQKSATLTWRAGGRRLDADAAESADAGTIVASRWDVTSFAHDYSGATYQGWLNGTAGAVTSSAHGLGNTSATNSQAGVIGSDNSATPISYFSGDVAEILVYQRVLTAAERAQVHSYLQDRYAITVSDYIPSSVAVPLSDTGAATDTLSISASPAVTDSAGAVDSFTVDVPPTPPGYGSYASGYAGSTGSPSVALSDVGAVSDTLTVTGKPTLTDAATVTDSLAVTGPTLKALTDAASGADSLAASAMLALSDSGSGGDSVTVTRGAVATPQGVFPGSTGAVTTRWRYLAQNILTGQFLHWDLPLKRDELRWDLSGPGSLRGTITPVRQDLLGADGQPILQEWATAIYAEADGHIRWGGLLVHSDFGGPEWAVECAGFTGYPAGRPYNGGYYSKINYDPTLIFRAIWTYLALQPDGDLGMEFILPTDCPVRVGIPGVPGYTTYKAADGKFYALADMPAGSRVVLNARADVVQTGTSTMTAITIARLDNFAQVPIPFFANWGNERVKVTARSGLKMTIVRGQEGTTATAHVATVDLAFVDGTETALVDPVPAEPYALTWWESTDCGNELDKLAQETPFDYSEEHFWDGDVIRHRVRVDYPRLGRRRSLAFVQGANVTNVVTVTRSGDDFANTVIVLGKGEGSAMIRAEVAVRDGRLRRPVVITDKSIATQSRAVAVARAEFIVRQLLPVITSISVIDHPNAPIGSWNIGDDILIKADLPWIGWTEIWCRVTSWSLDSDYTATLTVARSDSFRYGPSGTVAV